MSLAPSVLKKALADLIFFGLVFGISVLSFSSMMFIQLGPVMLDFNDQQMAFISLVRALFGDFDIDHIMSSSPDYLNSYLMLTYLFVAVFIMLSMFFAILGESQANLRDDQRRAKQAGIERPEYGVFVDGYRLMETAAMHLPGIGPKISERVEKRRLGLEPVEDGKADTGPSAVDRIEARQLEMTDRLLEITSQMHLQPKTPSPISTAGDADATPSRATTSSRPSSPIQPETDQMRHVVESLAAMQQQLAEMSAQMGSMSFKPSRRHKGRREEGASKGHHDGSHINATHTNATQINDSPIRSIDRRGAAGTKLVEFPPTGRRTRAPPHKLDALVA